MKSIDQILGASKAICIGEPYQCECGESVQNKQMNVIGGPNKGQPIVIRFGCKCEDKRLAAEAVEVKQRLEMQKVKEFFDQNSLLNKDLASASFENFQSSKSSSASEGKQAAMQFVQAFNREDPSNLLFFGPPQKGKSHLSVAITKAVMQKGYSALFISVPKLLTKIKSTYNKNSSITEEDLLKHLKSVDVLVIDDLGAEKNETQKDKAWSDSLIWQIIDDRQGKHTIYTSNLTEKGLQEFYEERTFKRMMKRTEKIVMR